MGKLKFFASVASTLVTNLGTLRKTEKLTAEGKLAERDAIMNDFADKACAKFFRSANINISMEGEENIPAGTCVFVANHQSMFDALVMLDFAKNNRPCGFIMKKEFEKVSLIKRWCAMLNCVFVDRQNPREAVKALKAASANLERGVSMVVFPEGTRTKDYPHISEFKNGAFKIAQSGKYPIVPVVLFDTGARYEAAGKLTGGTVHIKVLPPVTLSGTDRHEYKQAAADLQEIFTRELAAFHNV
ncbi:MAG: 1-acyl-sn-glycerol-3-phosphate acyltransferase [Clostridia bacterium]|nr:1-acyl-sn-glycerol-3-phosphate acyltransferase [Clostridia bacterium]